ncbi:hypothetical protein D3C87_1961780 [compost metagenome]
MRAKPLGRAAQQLTRPGVLAQLRHGDAAQRQRRRVIAQGHPLQRAQRIAGGKRTGGGGDQRIHGAAGYTKAELVFCFQGNYTRQQNSFPRNKS